MKNTDPKIEEIVIKQIEADENLGDHSGGSGHLSNVSYYIDHIEVLKEGHIQYFYTIEILTEFTSWPDNPPYENHYQKNIMIDANYQIVEKSEKKYYSISELPNDIAWPLVQKEINKTIVKFFAHIEWNYGENRAPFEAPPIFNQNQTFYTCELVVPDSDNYIIQVKTPFSLLTKFNEMLLNDFHYQVNDDLDLIL